ncbi:acylphosphatase, partial [Litorivivens sp.]
MERCRFLVKGRVQGVGFRAHCQRLALAEGLCGWAINCPDG